MPFKDGRKSGGRKAGTANKTTSARYAAMARVNEALSAIGEDSITGRRLLKEVLNHRETPLDVKIQCAGLLTKLETETAETQRYVAVMPLPVKDLDEWKKMYMQASPNATPEDVAWHEKIAAKVLEQEQSPTAAKPPFISDDIKDESNGK
jgi:hypothetical protein